MYRPNAKVDLEREARKMASELQTGHWPDRSAREEDDPWRFFLEELAHRCPGHVDDDYAAALGEIFPDLKGWPASPPTSPS